MKSLLLIPFFILGLKNSYCQNISITDIRLSYENIRQIEVDSASSWQFDEPMELLNTDDSLIIQLNITVNSLENTQQLWVKLGTTLHGEDLLNSAFPINENSQSNYLENKVNVVLGRFIKKPIYYLELKIENNSGGYSSVVNYQSDI